MADVRLETIQRQDAPALSLGDPLQASSVGEREGEQFVIAFEEMRDRPWGDRHPTGAQVLMDFRQAAVLCVAQRANPGNDIAAKPVLGQGEPSLCFRSVGAAKLWTGPVETAPDVQGEMHHVVQGRDGTIIIYHPQSGWFEDTPLKGGAEEGYPLKGVHEGTCLCEAQQRAWNHSRASWVSPW
jgi:hypothetical protein